MLMLVRKLNEALISSEQMAPFTAKRHKLALVIGINEYSEHSSLRHCINDADDIARELKSINFDVLKKTNCDYNEFKKAIDQFVERIELDDLVLFYFAGHGNEFDSKNYLLPAKYSFDHLKSEREYIQEHSINVQYILHKIEKKKPDSIIMILDCCRSYIKTRSTTSETGGGLASIKGPPESLIAFSCGFNQGAIDDTRNNRNGIFTEHLLKHLTTANQDIATILENVGRDIKSHGFPLPWRSTCLTKKVYLVDQIRSYKKNGVIIAGHNQQGTELHQLSFPSGICVDDNQTVYITEWNNHRVVAWKYGSTSGQVIAGGNGQGNQMNQLSCPTDVIIDNNKINLIICDQGNRRVVRWPLNSDRKVGEILISNIACNGLAMDNQGFLYVSDVGQSCVIRWNINDCSKTIVAGGNGKGNQLNQLNDPYYIFIDRNYSIYISDNKNHRVIKWDTNAKQGVIVAGGQGEGKLLTQLSDPLGVIVDQCGAIYVADAGNSRVMRWNKDDMQGSILIGNNNQGNQLRRPNGLEFDRQDNLYVVEEFNHRVQRFDIVLKP